MSQLSELDFILRRHYRSWTLCLLHGFLVMALVLGISMPYEKKHGKMVAEDGAASSQ